MRPIDFFDTAVDACSSHPAIVDGDLVLSYEELRWLSRRIAVFVEHVNGGEPLPIAICAPNDYRHVAVTLGIMRAGGVVMPLHTRSSWQQIGDYLGRLNPSVVFYHSSVAALIQAVRVRSNPRRWICLDATIDGDMCLDDAIRDCGEYTDRWASPFGNPDRLVFARQTSGTTGHPKVVLGDIKSFAISHVALVHRIAASVENDGVQPVCLVAAPFSHAAGLHALAMLTLGSALILLREFDVAQVLETVARRRVTHMWLPASALNLIVARIDSSFGGSSLRQVLVGASAASPAKLREAVSALGPCIAVHYGQIEGGFLTWLDEKTLAAAARGDRPERLASSGKSMYVGRIAIVDDEALEVTRGQVGEIVARGLAVKPYMTSMWAIDDTEMSVSKSRGWHHTGDLGYVDTEGYLYVVGRKKDMVITGGFKVSAAEVERVIMEMPEVAECAVIAVPDAWRGEAVKAIVTSQGGTPLSTDAVMAHCRSRLGTLNSPATIEQWAELPRTAVGKLDKREIRKEFWRNCDRGVN